MMIGAAAAVVIAAAGSTLIYWNLPQTKLSRALDEAEGYEQAADYAGAQQAYEKALEIDEQSVVAYRGLADGYLAQGQQAQAESILMEGYEAIGSEVLLQNYCAVILNDVVAKINEKTVDFASAGRCLDVLELMPESGDALSVLTSCANLLLVQEDKSMVMLDGLDGSSDFAQYEALMKRIFDLAAGGQTDLSGVIDKFAVMDAQEIYLSLDHAQSYREILNSAAGYGVTEAAELLSCLDKQEEISEYFAPMFEDFEAENYKAAKEFIVTDEYEAVRDAFINGTMDCWYGNTYIPVTKEAIYFLKEDESWMFAFVEDDTLAQPTGTIRVLGQKMRDLGVQRSAIEYVPAYDPADYYPHIEYEIVYWNTMVSGIATDNTNVVSRMNYRFAEKIYNADGMEANMIYDWGGSNEKRQKEQT